MDASPSSDRFWRASVAGGTGLGSALEFAAEGVCAIADLPLTIVNVVRGDHVVISALAGSREWRGPTAARALIERLLSRQFSLAMVEQELLARGTRMEPFVYISATDVPPEMRLDEEGHPDHEPADSSSSAPGGGRWRSGDLLLAPIRDEQHRLRGLLTLAGPREWLLPPADRLGVLDWLIGRVRRVVLALVEQEEGEERIALAQTARDIIVRAVNGDSPEVVLDGVARDLMAAFEVETLRATLYDGDRSRSLLALGREVGYLDGWLPRRGRAAAERLWREQNVMVIGRGQLLSFGGTRPEQQRVLDFMEENGFESVLLTPFGAGETCLGSMALYRTRGAREWTGPECAIAQEIGRDVGRLVVLHRSLQVERAAAEELRALDAYRTNLIDTVAHELKNPVASILLNHDAVMASASPEQESSLARIAAAAARLERLAGALLLDSAAAREAAPPATRVDLQTAVRRAALEAANAAGVSADRIVLELDDAEVVGDGDQLETVMVNLIGNALKYSPPGSPVMVALRADEDEAVVSVTDRGPGISEDDQLQIFEKFFRSADPAVRAHPGSGLGLSIVRRLVEHHTGDIAVESKLGEGSTFVVYLPAAGTRFDAAVGHG